MTAIAILADAHLPDGSGTAQHACFEWAIGQLQRLQPDFIVTAGDMTACGDIDAARLVRQGLESVGVPFLSTPGNCEMKSLQTTPELESLLLTEQVLENREILILACNTMTGAIAPGERQAAETIAATAGGRPLVLVTHYYPEALDADSAAWLREFLDHRHGSRQSRCHRGELRFRNRIRSHARFRESHGHHEQSEEASDRYTHHLVLT